MVRAAAGAIREGASLLIVSDRGMSAEKAPIPSLLATAALHHGLLDMGLRGEAGLVIESGEPREVMHFCLLSGYGADAINPYLALEAIHHAQHRGEFPPDADVGHLVDKYVTAVKKGILKTISKMGISTLRSYQAAQLFEAIGLNREVIDSYFKGTASRIEGIGLDIDRHGGPRPAPHRVSSLGRPGSLDLDFGGEYYHRLDGEEHLWNPTTISRLQHAVRTNDAKAYAEYAKAINDQSRKLCTLRGLFEFVPGTPVPIEEVEPASEIVKRFCTGAMSHGSISKEAHETLAIAMNRLGGDEQHRRGRRGPRPLQAAAQRRLAQLRASSRWPAPASA